MPGSEGQTRGANRVFKKTRSITKTITEADLRKKLDSDILTVFIYYDYCGLVCNIICRINFVLGYHVLMLFFL